MKCYQDTMIQVGPDPTIRTQRRRPSAAADNHVGPGLLPNTTRLAHALATTGKARPLNTIVTPSTQLSVKWAALIVAWTAWRWPICPFPGRVYHLSAAHWSLPRCLPPRPSAPRSSRTWTASVPGALGVPAQEPERKHARFLSPPRSRGVGVRVRRRMGMLSISVARRGGRGATPRHSPTVARMWMSVLWEQTIAPKSAPIPRRGVSPAAAISLVMCCSATGSPARPQTTATQRIKLR